MKKRINAANRFEELNATPATSPARTPRSHAPAPGQFHPLAVDSSPWNEFVLVLEKKGNTCTVIPGNMDASLGGPDDILIPGTGSEPYWMLGISSAYDLPEDALLPAFAKTTAGVLNYVKTGMEKCRKNEPFGSNYRFCLPYIGSKDSRITYHKGQLRRLKQAKEKAEMKRIERLATAFTWRCSELDVRPLKMGMAAARTPLSAFSYVLAAGEKGETVRMTFVPADYPCDVIIKWSPETEKLFADVYDRETGARDEKTLEGFQLRDLSNGLVLGTFHQGHLSADYSKSLVKDGSGFYLARPNNDPLQGEWKKE